MRLITTILCFLCCVSFAFSQDETRLALVIGNANYVKGELKNPVNDALLMARTLDSLDFDVILDTNITSKSSFIKTIRNFGSKRDEYDVAWVYYAGHGIQIGSENYLLPTECDDCETQFYNSEDDVFFYGVHVQTIMKFLNTITNKVNVLILDACRDNPYESNWSQTRSLQGNGLAKIPPHRGSLIAFSTGSGSTAFDGDTDNSIYCESLSRNMLKPNISLDQIFRNVRMDVLQQTDGKQGPVEASQLTGQTYYLLKKEDYSKIDVNNISALALHSISDRDYKSAIDYLTLLEVFYKSNLNHINQNDLAHVYLELGRCNLELYTLEPDRFYESKLAAGEWDELSYEEYLQIFDVYLNYASSSFLSAKTTYESHGIDKGNRTDYSEAFYKYLRSKSYIDYAKRGLDETTFLELIHQLNEFNKEHFGVNSIKTACSHYLLALFNHQDDPLYSYANFLISANIFDDVYTSADDVNDYAISFDIIFPYKWSLLSFNSILSQGFVDNYYVEDKGKVISESILDHFNMNSKELYDDIISIIEKGLKKESITNDFDGFISEANRFSHLFPLFFELSDKDRLECLELTVHYNNIILSLDASATYTDSISTYLNNSISYSNYIIDDDVNISKSNDILEKMIKYQIDAFTLATKNSDGSFAIKAVNDYMSSYYYYREFSKKLQLSYLSEMLDVVNSLFNQTLRDNKQLSHIDFMAEYFHTVQQLIDTELITDAAVIEKIKTQHEFYNFLYD
jgi:hypothetical protein